MANDRTNILLITSDQQHWNTLGCRYPEVKTPNLDRLAEQGTLYNRAYLLAGAVAATLFGLLRLQQRERFV